MSKIKLDFIVIAEKAAQDTNGNVNIFGVFNGIISNSFPALHPSIAVVFRVSSTETNIYDYELEISNPNGKKVEVKPEGILKNKLDITEETKNRAGVIINIAPFTLELPGEYKVILKINGSKLGETSFWAEKV